MIGKKPHRNNQHRVMIEERWINLIVIQSRYRNGLKITDTPKLVLGSHMSNGYTCVCLTPMSTTFVNVGIVSVFTCMEELQRIIHLSEKLYFGQGECQGILCLKS